MKFSSVGSLQIQGVLKNTLCSSLTVPLLVLLRHCDPKFVILLILFLQSARFTVSATTHLHFVLFVLSSVGNMKRRDNTKFIFMFWYIQDTKKCNFVKNKCNGGCYFGPRVKPPSRFCLQRPCLSHTRVHTRTKLIQYCRALKYNLFFLSTTF